MTSSLHPKTSIHVPDDAFSGDVPLVAVLRAGFVLSLHRGTVVVSDPEGRAVLSLGNPAEPAFLRSAAKPFQVMPAVLSGAVDQFNLSQRELAVLCASHSAEVRHMETILGILEKAGLEETALQCGVHEPLHAPTARLRAQQGLEPSPVCNNCSGAHTGMLLACVANGWPIDGYGNAEHPLQQETLQALGVFAGLPAGDIMFGVDNCHVPAFRLPAINAATAFARLATGVHLPPVYAEAAARVRTAMTAHPEMIAGEGRFDTALMSAAGGAVVMKGGADGFQGLGLPGAGLGLAVKITDGAARAVAPAVLQTLKGLDVLPAAVLDQVSEYAAPELRDLMGELVGQIAPVFAVDGRV